jgi:CheY-like chemotaxis protein
VSEWILPGLGGDLLLQLLEPLQRTVILFTDREIPNLPYFLNRNGVKTVISKKKRSELLQLVSQMRDSSPVLALKRTSLPGKRLLLAEDSPTVRHFIRRAIEAQHPDWALSEAGNAQQALAEIAHNTFDLMVLDLEIPGTDGQVFLSHLLEKPQMKYKSILALAPCNQRGLRETFKKNPHVIFLPKPVTAGQVLDTIHVVFGEKRLLAAV